MATYCPEDVSSRELSCPICFEDYDIHNSDRAPRLLLCLHTFCHDCTRKLWRPDGTLECSLCRMVHEQVALDDLFDNHVIVQYLRQESEQKDLDMARRLDEDFRQGAGTTSTPASWDSGDPRTDTSDIDEQQAAEVNELPLAAPVSDSLFRNFLDELMENFGSRQDAVADDLFNQDNEEDEEEEDDEEEEEAGEDMPEEMEPEEPHEDSIDCTSNAANPAFSLSNIQALFGQLDEVHQSSDSEEPSSDGEPVANMSSLVNFLAMINQAHETDNEEDVEEEEEEDEEERWHSASDEFQTPLWVEEDTVELEDRSSEADEWQIITQESFLGE